MRMFPPRLLQRIALTCLSLCLPLAASAAVSDFLKTPNDSVVSRGEFVRATVQSLGLSTDKGALTQKYLRPVPKQLVPFVGAAEKSKALVVFGKDLGLSKGITRGEALSVIVAFQHLSPTTQTEHAYSDVTKGSSMEDAVLIAIEKNWMTANRPNVFGVNLLLTGREARELLRNAVGERSETTIESGQQPAKIPAKVIQIKTRDVTQLPQQELLRTIWQLLNDQFLYQDKIVPDEAAYKAAEALVNSLGDQYTTFMRPADAKQFQEQIKGELSGIGAQVEYADGALTVIAPISGSPAEKAGVKAGDKITAVDGVSLVGLDLAKAISKVRGAIGTVAKLTIRRGSNEIEISVTRDIVRMPEIDISYQGDIAIVKLVQFGTTTDTKLRGLLVDVQKRSPSGLVLDLRNNPGGLLHAAEIVLSNFLPEGSGVAVIKSKKLEHTEVTSDAPTISKDVPMVVLVNKGSASASEIVAGALQDYGRATIMGETTYGKGTVQQVVEFRDGSSMKMTIAEWLSPKGRKINGVGVSPDVEVKASDARDEQLLRAIDALR